MKFKQGCQVPNPDIINESFMTKEQYILANVDSAHLLNVLLTFIDNIEEPGFLFLEVPLNSQEESKLRKSNQDPFHKGIYYLDNLSKAIMKSIIECYKTVLLQDGLIHFGFASHRTKEEIVIGKYNVVTIYSRNLSKWANILSNLSIPKVERIVSAWDTFTETNPGQSFAIKDENLDIYVVLEELQKNGLYLYEIREE